jgi:predicted ATPase
MYMSRFGVKNYKCLGEIDIPLMPIHVLIGENDAGKTSLLEAIAAFHASSEGALSNVFPEPWGGRELVFHGSPEPRIELWGEWSAHEGEKTASSLSVLRYGFAATFLPRETERKCETPSDWLDVDGQRKDLRPRREELQGTALFGFNQGHKIPDVDPRVLKDISSSLKPVHTYAFDPKTMAIPAAIDLERKFRLDADGFGLATLLADILEYEAERFIHLNREFCGFFKQFRRVRVESQQAFKRKPWKGSSEEAFKRNAGRVKGSLTDWDMAPGKGVYFETHDGHSVRAQQASDGVILFLGFLALAHMPNAPNLLLIEEPDNGIYPKRLGEVIKLLKELVTRTEGVRFPQIIMSTHSPYLLSFFEPEEVTFLSRPPDEPGGPVRARPLRDAPNIRERMADGFYLGELWYNLSEEDLFGEP